MGKSKQSSYKIWSTNEQIDDAFYFQVNIAQMATLYNKRNRISKVQVDVYL